MSPLVANASNDPQERALQLDEAVQWARSNTFAATQYPVGRLLELKGANSVAVVIPSREVAATIDTVVASAVTLRDVGLVDEVIVVDADSQDGSASVATAFGATVYQEQFLMPQYGPVLGKGDAMWRALSIIESTVVVFVDSDTHGFGDHFIRGLLGPLLEHDHLQLVKGAYRRPFATGEQSIPDGGGRVSELTARPLLNLYFPELAAFQQPLSGELAARRQALEWIPFMAGYGIEIQMLIDMYRQFGLDSLAQSDLGERVNAHQSLADLGTMAFTVMRTIASRSGFADIATAADQYLGYREGQLDRRASEMVERPPQLALPGQASTDG